MHGFAGGFLAVDFFYMLSGFVVANAYEKRMASGLRFSGFVAIRVRRLWPTIICGVLVGAVAYVVLGHSVPATLSATALALLLVPNLGRDEFLFPTNGPQWSLFYEIFANLLHAAALRRCSLVVLTAIAATSFALLLLIVSREGALSTLGLTGRTFLGGFPRVMFGYTIGVILFRLHAGGHLPQVKVSAWIVAAALPTLFLLYDPTYWIVGPLLTLTFPIIMIAGIGDRLEGWEEALAKQFGRLSYPLYATHYPLVAMVMQLSLGRTVGIAAATLLPIAVAVTIAYFLEPRPSTSVRGADPLLGKSGGSSRAHAR